VAGALGDGLESLSAPDLKTLCKERGYKGYTSLSKAALIQRFRGGRGPSGLKDSRPVTYKAIGKVKGRASCQPTSKPD